MISRNREIVKTCHLLPKICLLCKVGYAHNKDLAIWPVLYITIAHNLMYYLTSANCFAHVNSRQVVKGTVWYASRY